MAICFANCFVAVGALSRQSRIWRVAGPSLRVIRRRRRGARARRRLYRGGRTGGAGGDPGPHAARGERRGWGAGVKRLRARWMLARVRKTRQSNDLVIEIRRLGSCFTVRVEKGPVSDALEVDSPTDSRLTRTGRNSIITRQSLWQNFREAVANGYDQRRHFIIPQDPREP